MVYHFRGERNGQKYGTKSNTVVKDVGTIRKKILKMANKNYKTLRLILGDQLNQKHSWYNTVDDTVIYFLAEMRQETDYTTHHIQKVIAFFSSMRNMASKLREKGHKVIYYQLDDQSNSQSLTTNLNQIIKKYDIDLFEYQLPDEYRLDSQLQSFSSSLRISTNCVDTEHFLTSRDYLSKFFNGKKQYVMEYFYRQIRKKFNILMDDIGEPQGGQWNFDKSNRKKWNTKDPIPPIYTTNKNVSGLIQLIQSAGVKTIGNIDAKAFHWPTSYEESKATLDYFCKHLLIHFGDYQDALHTEQRFLFHSRLSFSMNSKMLHPLEVVNTVIEYWQKHQAKINISQVEGFVRQIIGWREYMRGIYWMQMPEYATLNKLNNTNSLPDFYWTGKTKMNCLQKSIQQSLDESYAHHIQRLMITGNFALLAQVNPDYVDEWYLGIYIDAIEWVEITNTRGMSQWADGGIVATKPYVSSGSYINKMSNYCKECHYNVKHKTEEDACPFNSLYWNFLDDKKEYFQRNNRMSMMMRLLEKMDGAQLAAMKTRAYSIIKNPDAY